ncbi:MAG: type II toxin-antitoxin system MqsA family antitoxin, partial [Rhodobacteraceae bacterium]|nr:type II toxin-antitoxin system MqsA family antitoxin [Paracoccaceae bacterium]
LSPHDEREIEKYLTDARRTIDGLLTSHEIKTIREHFQMTQVEFARLLRVSDKTFARYENGHVAQGYAMDDLLRILREFPETIRAVSFSSSSTIKTPDIGTAREPASLP